MSKTGGVTQRVQDACFEESFTKLWRPQTWLPLSLQPCAKGPSPSPAPSPSSLGTSFCVSRLLRIPHSHLHPHTQAISFFHQFPSCQWLSLYLLLLLFSLPLSPQPQPWPHRPYAKGSVVPRSLQVHWPPLLISRAKSHSPQGNTAAAWLDGDTKKKNSLSRNSLFSQQTQREYFGAFETQHFRQKHLEEPPRTKCFLLSKPVSSP